MSSAPNPETNKMTRVNHDGRIDCCGLSELANIYENRDNPKQTIKEVCQDIYRNDNNLAFYVFSDIQKKIAGKNLKKYIIKNNLGKIVQSASRINPNSSNSLTIWIWAINRKNLYNFWKKTQNE